VRHFPGPVAVARPCTNSGPSLVFGVDVEVRFVLVIMVSG
jgi:hypothetical protein